MTVQGAGGDRGTSFKTAPAVGICVCERVVGGEPKLVDLYPFRSTRFAEGGPRVDEHVYKNTRGTWVSRRPQGWLRALRAVSRTSVIGWRRGVLRTDPDCPR